MNPAHLARVRDQVRPAVTRSGWVREDAAAYHGGAGLGSSQLKLLLESPAHYLHEVVRDTPKAQTPSQRFGTLAHEYILELKRPTVRPEGMSARTREGKEWAASTHGAVCTADELYALQQMSMAVNWALSTRGLALDRAECEVSGYATEGLYGFELRIRPDARFDDRGILLDLKTTSDPAREAFQRQGRQLRYDVQAAFYLNVANLIAGEERYREWWWVAVGTCAPYDVTIHRATPALISRGSRDMLRALERLDRALSEGNFPGSQEDGGLYDFDLAPWEREGVDGT